VKLGLGILEKTKGTKGQRGRAEGIDFSPAEGCSKSAKGQPGGGRLAGGPEAGCRGGASQRETRRGGEPETQGAGAET